MDPRSEGPLNSMLFGNLFRSLLGRLIVQQQFYIMASNIMFLDRAETAPACVKIRNFESP